MSHACPECGFKGKRVPLETVQALATRPLEAEASYELCLNPSCDLVYFKPEGARLFKSDLKVKVWFKEPDDPDCPVCYCSPLTRRQIRSAVSRGAQTIEEVRQLTGALRTGFCRTENPTGMCCHRALEQEIARLSAAYPSP